MVEDESFELEEGFDSEGNDDVFSNIPFDPNAIRVISQPLTIGDILDRLEYDEIKLDSEFQRRSGLWNNIKKSQFIESLLLKLPVPMFYFDGQDENKWQVIDGLQRISTLASFVLADISTNNDRFGKPLVLEGLEFLIEYNGKKFSELPREYQRRIKTFAINIYVLDKGTPEPVKYNIFSRINRGGLILTPQEIRNAIHQGKSTNVVNSLVDENTKSGKSFIKATDRKIKSDRMQDRDFAARFITFYLQPYQNYVPDLDSFMSQGMSKIKDLNASSIEKMESDFIASMDLAYDLFGKDAFRKRFLENGRQNPINKALFEILSVSFAKLKQEEREKLRKVKNIFNEKLLLLMIRDEKFVRSITQATASPERVFERFSKIETIIKETLAS